MSILSQLQSDPMGFLIAFLYRAPAVLIALTLHEMAHGYVAMRCGDPTAQMLGRLSFNPLKHLDPIGTVCLFLFGFGWAKPVPVNPRNFRHYRKDDFLVSIAGIVTNLCLFLFSTLLSALCVKLMFSSDLLSSGGGKYFLKFDQVGFSLLYNGYSDYIKGVFQAHNAWLQYPLRFLCNFSLLNLSLALFNLLPIPPLDGYHLFNDALFKGKLHIPARIMQLCMVALLVVNFATDFIWNFVYQVLIAVQSGVLYAVLPLFGMA